MTRREAQELLNKYASGTCSPEEKALVERWYQHELASKNLPRDPADHLATKAEIWNAISEMSGLESSSRRHKRLNTISAAAAIILILSTAAYFYPSEKHVEVSEIPIKELLRKADVEPASDKAVLTLADGSRILLDSKSQGLIAMQQGIKISQLSDGTITYEAAANRTGEAGALAYNTIQTPRGAKYQIILPDGSRVWLNAASSLRFPPSFSNKERSVELEGEAYFEVSKNNQTPFKVHTKSIDILVTGTQFNVMAYKDESFSATTLVEGSVDIKSVREKLSLTPGQQAIQHNDDRLRKTEVDVEQFIAWKNGLFQFDNSDIQSVMRQVGRWYDVTVEYRGKIPKTKFGGYISRDSKLSQVVKMLELSGVKFSLEDKKIIVLP